MKIELENLLQQAIKTLQEKNELPEGPVLFQLEPTKDKKFGDFATNVALLLAKSAQRKPLEIAEQLVKFLSPSPFVKKVEIAGPGFINFFLSEEALNGVVTRILKEEQAYGRSPIGKGKTVILEFVSSNPTGPLHVGHGRHAAFGDVIANLLNAVGFKSYKEYYVNDAGRQMDILAVSVWMRYLAQCGENIKFPMNGYKGDYVTAIGETIHKTHQQTFLIPAKTIFSDLPLDENEGGDKEIYIDALISRAKQLLKDNYEIIFALSLEYILDDIRNDLSEFNVDYDNWFSEKQFIANGIVDKLLNTLKTNGDLYEREGALWFRSTNYGDEKDRVLVRSNGHRTYFANDVAYHLNKFERGFDLAIDIFGSDHHGYIPRMKAAMEASHINPERLIYLLMQFVMLYRGGQPVQMSTRGGSFVTLRELRNEVGNDAARFFYVMRKCEQPIDFDLDLAKAKSNENPVYYVQYAHARICSVFKQMHERNMIFDESMGIKNLDLLTAPQERNLLNTLARYPNIILKAALQYEPHQLTNYLRDLATDFHAYYNSHQFLVEQDALRNARLCLVKATKQVLLNGFNLLGISAPEAM